MNKYSCAKALLVASAFALTACDSNPSFVGDNLAASVPETGGGTPGGGGGNEPAMVFGPGQVNGFSRVLLAGDSSKIVFTDDSDTLGTNPGDDWQVWSLDLASDSLVQLTAGDSNAFAPSSKIDISDNGDQVVFITSNDLTGDNPNSRANIFIAATDGSSTTQVTRINTGASAVREAVVSGDASIIALETDDDLTGDNPGLVGQIFTIDANGIVLTQITNMSLVPTNIAFSDDGSKIAFQSKSNPFGTNADLGFEIYVIGVDGSNLTQVTASDGDSLRPQLSDDASLVVFTSNGDHSAGSNTDGSFEIFVAPTDGSAITQISNSAEDTGGATGDFSISGDGAYVAFVSRADFTGENPANEFTLFTAGTGGGAVSQLLRQGTVPDTATLRDGDKPSLDNDGSTVSFVSFVNYTSTSQPSQDKIYTIARQ